MNRKQGEDRIYLYALIVVLVLSAVNGCMTQQDMPKEKLHEYGEVQ